MKVILISKTANIGNIGDVIDVKDGYARNFLIPRKKAIYYSAVNYKAFEEKKKQFEADNQNDIESASKVKDKINNKDIIIIENASDDGRLYGSVSTSVIADEINKNLDKEQAISRTDIILEKPIKETGVYITKIDLHSDVTFSLRLIVSRNKSEVQTLIKEFENKDSKKETKVESKSDDVKNPAEKELEAIAQDEEEATTEEAN